MLYRSADAARHAAYGTTGMKKGKVSATDALTRAAGPDEARRISCNIGLSVSQFQGAGQAPFIDLEKRVCESTGASDAP